MQMMTAVGKIQETKLLQDKHTLQLTVKINSLLVKIGYRTASCLFSLSRNHVYTQDTYTDLVTLIPRVPLSPCANGHHIKAVYCKDVVAAEPIKSSAYTMPISTEI